MLHRLLRSIYLLLNLIRLFIFSIYSVRVQIVRIYVKMVKNKAYIWFSATFWAGLAGTFDGGR